MSNKVECPHCHIGIFPMADGTCPSCRKNTRDLSGVDPDQVSLTVDNNEILPPFCYACGLPTERYVTVVQPIKGDAPSQWGTAGNILFGLFTGFWRTRDAGTGRRDDVIRVKVPQCEVCAAQGKPEPISVNTEELRLTFVVHKKFRQAVETAAE